jgi:hypothetical protein
MHFQFADLSLASLLALFSQDLGWLRLALGWSSLCFAWLALAYAFVGPAALLKGRHGRLSWLSWIGLAPYHALNELSLWLCRFSSEPAYHEIVPGLYLGRRLSPAQARTLEVVAVLDVTAELSECSTWLRPEVSYRVLATLDKTPLCPGHLTEAVDYLQQWLPKGSVYVHCALGHGRSASVVAAYLVASGQARDVEEAEAFLRERRPQVKLTPAQRESVSK